MCYNNSLTTAGLITNYDSILLQFTTTWLLNLERNCYSVGCLWHSHGKNPVWLYPKLQSQPIGLPKIFISIISSSKPTNQIVQNLYRFLIDFLPLKNVESQNPGLRTFLAKFVALEFSHSWIRVACVTSEILRDTGKSRKATKAKLFLNSLHDYFFV